jgi:muramoyltetrapeptide carboxypeptidase
LLRRHAKPFIGYSDITALHLAISRYAGFVTFHGPMLNADLLGDKQAPTESSLLSMLRGQLGTGAELKHPVAWPLTTIAPGIACGRLQSTISTHETLTERDSRTRRHGTGRRTPNPR